MKYIVIAIDLDCEDCLVYLTHYGPGQGSGWQDSPTLAIKFDSLEAAQEVANDVHYFNFNITVIPSI